MPFDPVYETIGNEIQRMILEDAKVRINEEKEIERMILKDANDRINESALEVPGSDQSAWKVPSTPSAQRRANSVSSATSAAPHAWGFGKATTPEAHSPKNTLTASRYRIYGLIRAPLCPTNGRYLFHRGSRHLPCALALHADPASRPAPGHRLSRDRAVAAARADGG
jgi:hypothetical protein